MDLSQVTPLIITLNEEANLRATLEGVKWARQIVLIDSGSTDRTCEIAAEFPQVKLVHRKFDSFAAQCNFGLTHITTPWVLSLDADYVCPAAFEQELVSFPASPSHAGYRAKFVYSIFGRPLRSSLYPPRTVLYQKAGAQYLTDGHAHRVTIAGPLGDLTTPLYHDDRKPLRVWLEAQVKYAAKEADKLHTTPRTQLSWKDKIRKLILPAAPLTILYCLFAKGLILNGWPGIYYALQRTYAELLLSLELLDRQLRTTLAPRDLK